MAPVLRALSLKNAIFAAGFALGAYHLLVVSGVIAMSTMPMRVTHVMLALSLLFVINPVSQKREHCRRQNVVLGLGGCNSGGQFLSADTLESDCL